MQAIRTTHQVEIGGRWHNAELLPLRGRWVYYIHSLARYVADDEKDRFEQNDRIREITRRLAA